MKCFECFYFKKDEGIRRDGWCNIVLPPALRIVMWGKCNPDLVVDAVSGGCDLGKKEDSEMTAQDEAPLETDEVAALKARVAELEADKEFLLQQSDISERTYEAACEAELAWEKRALVAEEKLAAAAEALAGGVAQLFTCLR
jgi:hypothetical protein